MRSSAHFPPPVLKATCQPYRRVKSPKELCARRDTLEPVDVIDLTGDDDESEPWVQTVPRKKRRLRDHHQSISSTLRDIRLDSSTPLATFSTEDPSTEYSTQNFTVDSSPGSSVTLVDHPTEADILGFCIRNAFEKADDDTKVWCRMCK